MLLFCCTIVTAFHDIWNAGSISGISSLLYLGPIWGIYSSSMPGKGVVLLCSNISWSLSRIRSYALWSGNWIPHPCTVIFDGMVWWLSHCRYRSVWTVGFLYTEAWRLPSSIGVIKDVQEGHGSIWSCFFNFLNLVLVTPLVYQVFHWSYLYVVFGWLWMYHPQTCLLTKRWGWWWCQWWPGLQSLSMNRFATMGLMGDPIAAPSVCS